MNNYHKSYITSLLSNGRQVVTTFNKESNTKWGKDIVHGQAVNYTRPCNGYGIVCGEKYNLTVIDIDVKDGGMDAFKNRLAENNMEYEDFLSKHVHQTTPNGGLHFFFNYNPWFRTGAKKLKVGDKAVGIDYRNTGSYIMLHTTPVLKEDGSMSGAYKMSTMNQMSVLKGNDLTDVPLFFIRWNGVSMSDAEKDKIEKGNNAAFSDDEEDVKEIKAPVGKAPECKEEVEFRLRTTDNTNEQLFIELLDMHPDEKWIGYSDWRDRMWIIMRLFTDEKRQFEMAHLYSKKSPQYDMFEALKEIEKLKVATERQGYGFTQLVEMCKEIDEDKTVKIIYKYTRGYKPDTKKINQFNFKDKEKNILALKNKYAFHLFKSKQDMIDTLAAELSEVLVYIINSQEFFYKLDDVYATHTRLPLMSFEYIKNCKKGKDGKVATDIETITLHKFVNDYNKYISTFNSVCCDPFESNPNKFNLFIPHNLEIIDKPKDTTKLFHFIKHAICGEGNKPDTEAHGYIHLLHWLRSIFKYTKTDILVLLYSWEHGVGKDTLKDFIMGALTSNLCLVANSVSGILSTHQDFLGKIFCYVGELAQGEGGNYHDNYLQIKGKITDNEVAVNKKFKDIVIVKNLSNWMFSTNQLDAFKIESEDRRFLCLESKSLFTKDQQLEKEEYYTSLREEFFNQDGYNAFYTALMQMEFPKANYRFAPMTDIKEHMTAQTSVQEFFKDLPGNGVLYRTIDDSKYITPGDLYSAYACFYGDNGFKGKKDDAKLFGVKIKQMFPDLKKVQKRDGGKPIWFYNLDCFNSQFSKTDKDERVE